MLLYMSVVKTMGNWEQMGLEVAVECGDVVLH